MTQNQHALFSPLTLGNGQELSNRLCKAAMEENLADWGQVPGQRLRNLYGHWANGGAGLVLTGNVMVAADALTGPGGVVLNQQADLDAFKRWAAAGKSETNQLWMQISHPGRQLYAAMHEQAVSASAVALDMGGFSSMFAQPRAMTLDEINIAVERFAITAELAERAGFDGVQIHAAHGYLVSQFLSPLVNLREDEYGGTLANRSRFLFEIVDAVRARVGKGFAVAVKLNSADFQKGGFDSDDASWVVEQLNHKAVDLVELSGGSYESPAMQGNTRDNSSTLRREAYFVDFARQIARVSTLPIMVTGGITRRQVAEDALAHDQHGFGVSVLGLARAMAYFPDLPKMNMAVP